MADENQDSPENALAYAFNGGGINNQKLALFGLFMKAFREGPCRVVLPDILIFDQVTFSPRRVPLRTVFRLEPLHDFATRHGIEVLDVPPCGDRGGWHYFHHGCNFLPFAKVTSQLGVDSVACDFFRSLIPVLQDCPILKQLRAQVYDEKGIRTVAALRIELDWSRHAMETLARTASEEEDNNPSFLEILAKVKNTLSDYQQGIYVACDEAALPVPKDEIRETAKSELGIDLRWKSDFISTDDLRRFSPLDLSLIDFEMAVVSDSFVGVSRSTFSNLVSLERYARGRQPVTRHHLYNLRMPRLALRTDNGAFYEPQLATAADPHDKAYSFLLAQIYHANGEKRLALNQYLVRANLGGPALQQVFMSLYRAGQLKAELGLPASEVVETFMRAADILPSRAEALHSASRYCRENRLFRQGYEIAGRAIDLAPPATGLLIENWVYEYGALDEYAVNAYWAGEPGACLDASLRILERGRLPEEQRPRIVQNARFALEKLDASLPTVVDAAHRLRQLEHPAAETQVPQAPSSNDRPNELASLYARHHGKVSDRWESYFSVYEDLFRPLRDKPIAMLEIGVQNGGSLAIWSEYFPAATRLVGCDIDARCADLEYDDARISVVVGDANAPDTCSRIMSIADRFDLVIDDGSHVAQDIIASFVNYFPCVTPGGLYVVEDLHAAYYRSHGGGITNPLNPVRFFSLLVDMINHEHWQGDLAPEILLAGFFPNVPFPEFLREGWIASISFFNSIAVIRRGRAPAESRLGRRIVVGETALVAANVLRSKGNPDAG